MNFLFKFKELLLIKIKFLTVLETNFKEKVTVVTKLLYLFFKGMYYINPRLDHLTFRVLLPLRKFECSLTSTFRQEKKQVLGDCVK